MENQKYVFLDMEEFFDFHVKAELSLRESIKSIVTELEPALALEATDLDEEQLRDLAFAACKKIWRDVFISRYDKQASDIKAQMLHQKEKESMVVKKTEKAPSLPSPAELFLQIILNSATGAEGMLEVEQDLMIRQSEESTCLYVRLRKVYPCYREAMVKRGIGPMPEAMIKGFLYKSRFFLKYDKNTNFPKLANKTSAMVFNYDLLKESGLSL